MKYLINEEVKKVIMETLDEVEAEKLHEAFAAQPKKFRIITDFLSEENVNNHIELYEDYLQKFSLTSTKLDSADRSKAHTNHSDYRSYKADETFNMNGAYLHELYFANIADNQSRIAMDSLSYMRLNRDFGTFDDWQRDFIACSMAARNGWAVMGYSTMLKRYINTFIDLHSLNCMIGFHPVVVMDCWEHSYYRDYLKDRKTYVYAMMKELNWDVIESRIKVADQIHGLLK